MKRIICILMVLFFQLHLLADNVQPEETEEDHSVEMVQEEKILEFEDLIDLVEVLDKCESMTRKDIELAIMLVAKDNQKRALWDYFTYSTLALTAFIAGVAAAIGSASICYRMGRPWRWFISEGEPFSIEVHKRTSSTDSDIV